VIDIYYIKQLDIVYN